LGIFNLFIKSAFRVVNSNTKFNFEQCNEAKEELVVWL